MYVCFFREIDDFETNTWFLCSTNATETVSYGRTSVVWTEPKTTWWKARREARDARTKKKAGRAEVLVDLVGGH